MTVLINHCITNISYVNIKHSLSLSLKQVTFQLVYSVYTLITAADKYDSINTNSIIVYKQQLV